MDDLSLGKRFRSLRVRSGLTIAEFSNLHGINKAYIYQIESDAKCPSIPMLLKLCDALNITPNDLLLKHEDLKHFETNALLHKMERLSERDFNLIKVLVDKMVSDKEI